jgi:hypothetical protein
VRAVLGTNWARDKSLFDLAPDPNGDPCLQIGDGVSFPRTAGLVERRSRPSGREWAHLEPPQALAWACAHALARSGAAVSLWDLKVEPLEAVVVELEQYERPTRTAIVDVSDSGHVNAAMEEVADGLGRVDIVLANAGIGGEQKPRAEFVFLDRRSNDDRASHAIVHGLPGRKDQQEEVAEHPSIRDRGERP